MYEFAANKNKLNRAIAFVNSSLGEQQISEETREQMVKEHYIQSAGLVIEEPAPKRGRPKKEEIKENEVI